MSEFLKMRPVRVCFADSRYDYETTVNGTDSEIKAYFLAGPMDLGVFPQEDLQTAVRVEFLDREPNPLDGSMSHFPRVMVTEEEHGTSYRPAELDEQPGPNERIEYPTS